MLINPVVKKPLSSYLDSQQQSIASQVMREAVGSILVAATNNDADDSSDDSSDDDDNDDDDDDDSSTSSSETMQQLISTSKNKIDSKINDVSTKLISNASPTTTTAPATRTSSSSTLTTPATASNIKKNVATTKRTNKNNNTIAPTTVTMNNNKNNGNNSKKRNNNNNNNKNNSDTKNTPQIVTKATPASKKVVALNTGSFKAQQNSKLNNRQANADLLKSLISSDTSPTLPNTSFAVAPASPAVEARVAVVTQSSPIVAVVTQSSAIKDRRTQQTRKRKVTELTPDKSKTASPNKKKK